MSSDNPQQRMTWLPMASNKTTLETDSAAQPASTEAKCSLCGHPFVRSESRAFPFCSRRCQQIDLGQWLDERLGLPIEGQEEGEFSGFEPPEDTV